ncbi:MAG: hypothetical protein RIS18_713 [Actinomycetota bacterium]
MNLVWNHTKKRLLLQQIIKNQIKKPQLFCWGFFIANYETGFTGLVGLAPSCAIPASLVALA